MCVSIRSSLRDLDYSSHLSQGWKSLLRNSVVPPGLGSFFPLFPALEALG